MAPMAPFQRYLAKEVTLDHVDGIITLRQAPRRLGLLSREGGTASFADPAQVTAKLGEIAPERFVADMKVRWTSWPSGAVYAEQDQRVDASRPAAEAAKKAGLTYELATFAGVQHAFFNDTGQRYDGGAATPGYDRPSGPAPPDTWARRGHSGHGNGCRDGPGRDVAAVSRRVSR